MLTHVNRLSDRLPLRELDAQPDDACPVGFKHLDVEARVFELLPRGGHATQESFDKPRDCRAVVAFELLPRYFLQAVDLRAAPEYVAARILFDDFTYFGLIFVADLAHDLFEQVLDGHKAGDSAEFIDRDGHVVSDRKSTRLNSSHPSISYAVFCLKKKKNNNQNNSIFEKKDQSEGHCLTTQKYRTKHCVACTARRQIDRNACKK